MRSLQRAPRLDFIVKLESLQTDLAAMFAALLPRTAGETEALLERALQVVDEVAGLNHTRGGRYVPPNHVQKSDNRNALMKRLNNRTRYVPPNHVNNRTRTALMKRRKKTLEAEISRRRRRRSRRRQRRRLLEGGADVDEYHPWRHLMRRERLAIQDQLRVPREPEGLNYTSLSNRTRMQLWAYFEQDYRCLGYEHPPGFGEAD